MPATVSGAPCSQAQVNGLVEGALPQGCWSDDYLWLTDRTRRLVEFADGCLEILPMPSRRHQRILAFLYSAFRSFLQPLGGEVLFAPLRLRVRPGKFREPDLLLLRDTLDGCSGDRYWTGADLVVEMVGPDNPQRDFVDKRLDYADAGVAEYWIGRSRHGDRHRPRAARWRLCGVQRLPPARLRILQGCRRIRRGCRPVVRCRQQVSA